jgi:ribosomal protein S6
VYSRNGVVTNIKSFGRVNLAYGIKKRDGRFFEVSSLCSSVSVQFRISSLSHNILLLVSGF